MQLNLIHRCFKCHKLTNLVGEGGRNSAEEEGEQEFETSFNAASDDEHSAFVVLVRIPVGVVVSAPLDKPVHNEVGIDSDQDESFGQPAPRDVRHTLGGKELKVIIGR